MSEVVSIVGIFLATFIGTFGMNFWKVLEEWQESPNRTTLWKSYFLCLVSVVLLNLGIYIWRLFCVEGGESFYPDYIQRTPQEWLIGGFFSSLIILLFLCFFIKDKYLAFHGQLETGWQNFLKRWKWFYITDLAIMVGSYAYQVYFYGWWPWY